MEIKAELKQPYTQKERMDFIVENNHNNGYEIRTNGSTLEAWGDTEDETLTKAREGKYQQALTGAKSYIENGAYYRYDENNTIEATDGNIGKLTAYALALQSGLLESVTWTSKEDNVLTLTAEEVTKILTGLGQVQAYVWNVQYIAYKIAIENATSLEELNSIDINYTSVIQSDSEETDTDEVTDDNSTDTTTDTVSDEVETADDTTTAEQDNADTDTVQETETADTGSTDTAE